MSACPRLVPPVCLAAVAALALAQPAKNVALLVGVNAYDDAQRLPALRFAEADIEALAKVLRAAGYDVTLLTGAKATKAAIEAKLREVLRGCKPGATAVVAFAGHGLQFDGQADAFFCPPETRPFADETATMVSLTKVYDELNKSFAGVKVLFVDACRNDPDQARGARSGVTADLAPRPPRGVAALFSCQAGEKAFEHESLGHGVFFHHVLKGLEGEAADRRGFVTFGGLSDYVAHEVVRGEQGVAKLIGPVRQTPNTRADYIGVPVLLKVASTAPAVAALPPKVEPRPVPNVAAPVPNAAAPAAGRGFTNHLGMTFVPVPKGTAYLGGGGGQPGTQAFTLSETLFCGIHEVTQKQWQEVMGSNPSYFKNTSDAAECPVESVSYNDIETYLTKLNAAEKSRGGSRTYRVSTEQEWEYICRGGPVSGAASAFHFYCGEPSNNLSGNDANFDADYPAGSAPKLPNKHLNRTSKVGSYKPNKLGIYDMHGNVWEWTSSLYETGGSQRVVRGGSWDRDGAHCAASYRDWFEPANARNLVGFRLLAVPSGQ